MVWSFNKKECVRSDQSKRNPAAMFAVGFDWIAFGFEARQMCVCVCVCVCVCPSRCATTATASIFARDLVGFHRFVSFHKTVDQTCI